MAAQQRLPRLPQAARTRRSSKARSRVVDQLCPPTESAAAALLVFFAPKSHQLCITAKQPKLLLGVGLRCTQLISIPERSDACESCVFFLSSKRVLLEIASREICAYSWFLAVLRITRQISARIDPSAAFRASLRLEKLPLDLSHPWLRRAARGRRGALASRRGRMLPARLRRRDSSALERWAGQSQQRSRPSRCDAKRQRRASVRSTRPPATFRATSTARDPCSACAPPHSKTSATFLYLGCRK